MLTMNILRPHIFEPFQDQVWAGFLGGPNDWARCIAPLQDILPVSPFQIYQPTQVHGKTVVQVGAGFKPVLFGKTQNLESLQNTIADGIYTTEKNIFCTVKTADCIGLLLYHPQSGTFSALHAGWRGLAQKIFTEFFLVSKIPAHECFVALSPSLGPCCSEFSNPHEETPDFFHPFIIGKYVHLWEIARQELLKNGVYEKNIEMPAFCTKCDPQKRFFSHRRGEKERNISGILLL